MADLIERYKITANLPSVMMNYCNRFNSKQIESITEMIYELENSIESADVQPVDRWISVKDRLPEENILVLCYARSTTGEGNNYFLGALAHGEFWFLKDNDIGHVSCPVLHWKVTHWQPLAESPKDGATNG